MRRRGAFARASRIGSAAIAILLLWVAAARADDPEGYRRETLPWGAKERSFLVHVPPRVADARSPLVIMLHGAGGSAAAFARETAVAPAADVEGMLVAVPDGTGDQPDRLSWNARFCCGSPVIQKTDDIGFIGAVIDRIATEQPLDRARIYVGGMSNGTMLAYQIAAAHPRWLAALAAVSGTIGGTDREGNPFVIAKPDMPIPVLIIHGRQDPYVLFEGGHSTLVSYPKRANMAVADALAFWSDVDGCDPVPDETEPVPQILRRIVYGGCRGGSAVVLWEIEQGQHEWPAIDFPAPDGGTRSPAGEILAFFAQHSRE